MSTTGCAFATGIYKGYSLDVTIKEEWSLGSQWYSIVDEDTVDFFMSYGMDAVNAIATATVTAIFKKDPWCLIAHPNSAIKFLPILSFLLC
jgi:NitT/TauT family transport system substrate-binding protein